MNCVTDGDKVSLSVLQIRLTKRGRCMSESQAELYGMAQDGINRIKSAILGLIIQAGDDGMRNVEIGKSLGVYSGHTAGEHEGHISRSLLNILQNEGMVEQRTDKKWYPIRH